MSNQRLALFLRLTNYLLRSGVGRERTDYILPNTTLNMGYDNRVEDSIIGKLFDRTIVFTNCRRVLDICHSRY